MIKFRFFFCAIFVFAAQKSLAQQNDFQTWSSFSLNYKINKQWQITFNPELRMIENSSEAGNVFVELGVQYRMNNNISLSLTDRNALQRKLNNSYSLRNRIMFDFLYKYAISKKCDVKYRLRLQQQHNDIDVEVSSRNTSRSVRNRLGCTFNLPKKLSLDISAEAFHAYEKQIFEFNTMRLGTSLAYDINKRNAVSIGFLFQKEYNTANPYTDYVLQLQYKVEIQAKKKKKE